MKHLSRLLGAVPLNSVLVILLIANPPPVLTQSGSNQKLSDKARSEP
jgi:hypothetical protein